jgi:hypothetical protein
MVVSFLVILMKRFFLFTFVILCSSFAVADAFADDGIRRIVRLDAESTQQIDPERLRSIGGRKGFENTPEGYFLCDNGDDPKGQSGAALHVPLNQSVAMPIIASAWSRAENVGGDMSPFYSLWLDLTYADGTNLWGQSVSFPTGTQDWNRKEVVVYPEKPVKSLNLHMMFRNHTGKAWFRDIELRTIDAPEGVESVQRFNGVSVFAESQKGALQKANSPRLLVRNVAKNSDFYDAGKSVPGINVKWNTVSQNITEYVLESRDDEDHLLTVVYTVHVPRKELLWWEHPRRSVEVAMSKEYVNTGPCAAGANRRLSYYPFAAVTGPQGGKAVGIDMLYPVVFCTGYNSGTEELFVAVDIALTKEKRTATLRFCTLDFEAKHGFRGALTEFYRLFPEQFLCRTPDQGIWMAFQKIGTVEGWEDFGFKFKECHTDGVWDDQHGILSFLYTEPGTWWMSMAPELPRTMEVAIAEVEKIAANAPQTDRSGMWARTLPTSGMRDADGNLIGRFQNTPWSNGIVWSLNNNPALPQPNAFSVNWGQGTIDHYFTGPDRKYGDLDGMYIDSSEGYVTAELNYHREHFAYAQRPLSFDREALRPVIFRGLMLQEFCKEISVGMRAVGKLMMANSTPHSLCWLAPHFDVLGTETNWHHGGKWRPMSDADMLYRRALSGPKPFCFLMNTNFENWTYEMSELFMKRSLAYGMFPSFFSADAATGHYFSQPNLYNRDRPLFKKYVPLTKMVAEAGWVPITKATSSDPLVYVERFGKYLTIFNDSPEKKTATITLESRPASLKEHVRGTTIAVKNGTFVVVLEAEDVLVVEEP